MLSKTRYSAQRTLGAKTALWRSMWLPRIRPHERWSSACLGDEQAATRFDYSPMTTWFPLLRSSRHRNQCASARVRLSGDRPES